MNNQALLSLVLALCCFASLASATGFPDEFAKLSVGAKPKDEKMESTEKATGEQAKVEAAEEAKTEATAAGETGGSSVEAQIRAIGDEMFTESANRLGYDDMIQRLMKLKNLLDQVPSSSMRGSGGADSGADDEQIQDVATITAALIGVEASIGDDPSCPVDSTEVVAKIRFFVEKFRGYGPNVRNFLEHLIRKIIAECGDEVEKVVSEDLNQEDREKLKRITRKLKEALRQSRSPIQDAAELLDSPAGSRAIIGYIKDESDDEDSGNDSFDEQYERDVEAPCRAVLLYLEGPTEVIRDCPAPDQLDVLDEEAIEWAEVYEACVLLDQQRLRMHAASHVAAKPIIKEKEREPES